MQLSMPAMFVMRPLCSCYTGGAPLLLVVPGTNARAALDLLFCTVQTRPAQFTFLILAPPKHTHIGLKKNTPIRYLHTITLQ